MHDRLKSRSVKKPRIGLGRGKTNGVKRAPVHNNGTAQSTEPLSYSQVVDGVRDWVNRQVPQGKTVAVVSKGDPNLIQFAGRVGWHFPRGENGGWAGFHPADSRAAIAFLEEVRATGAGYFLVPHTFIWWMDHYAEFKKYLTESYRLVSAGEFGLLYELSATGDRQINQVSMRVDYLLGVLTPLLEKLHHLADHAEHAPEDVSHELNADIEHRLEQIEHALHTQAELDVSQLERIPWIADHLDALWAKWPELQEKLEALAGVDNTVVLEQKLREQEEYLSALFERRLQQLREEHDRHLQEQHVVMLRLLEEERRLFQLNYRQLDEKLTGQVTATNALLAKTIETGDQRSAELAGFINQKVSDLEAAIVEQCDMRLKLAENQKPVPSADAWIRELMRITTSLAQQVVRQEERLNQLLAEKK